MCDYFQIKYKIVATRNHKVVSMEMFFWFLNKAITIALSDRDTISIFVEVWITSVYVWNRAPY